ncbi:ATP-binding protein [Metabacillus sp. FJAT-52054]|uniref:histidine kinase n=1 Tax=Metabacillus sediminis TaxID=3117746 RepID=A0ABZ2NG29_9BACI
MSFHIETFEKNENEDAYISLDRSWCIQFINAQGAKLFRDTPNKCIGRNVMDYLKHDDARTFKALFTEAIQHKESSRLKLTYQIDGVLKRVEICVYPAESGISLVFKDMTAAYKVEKAIHAKNEKLTLLSETASGMIESQKPTELLDTLFNKLSDYLDLDVYINYMAKPSSGSLVLANYSGITAKEAKAIAVIEFGQAVCGAVAESKDAMIIENVQNSLESRVKIIKNLGIKAYVSHPLVSHGKLLGTLSFGSKTRSQFKASEIELIQTACTQLSNLLERICMIAELKKNNIALTQAKDAAEKASKAKSHFLSMMSHELRTPLHTIMGFSDILLDKKDEPLTNRQKEKISKISNAADHLLHVINDILDLVRLEKGKPFIKNEITPVKKIVKDSIKWILPFAETKGITIETNLHGQGEIFLTANKVRLKQIMLNLLSNAVKYNRDHGRIEVIVSQEIDFALIQIKDTGFGISKEDELRIFDPFFRSDSHYWDVEGSGVGLSLTKQLADEMGGSLGVKSTLGEGSLFWVKLPLK